MKQMNILYTAILCLALLASACTNEDTPENTWEYPGPRPAITNGPAKAQKMCYGLWQKYDLHVYYNLSGDEALKSGIGEIQVMRIKVINPNALPMQAANEASAERFLTLFTHFYELLPAELVTHDLHRRHVLVKINPAENRYTDTDGNRIYAYSIRDGLEQGILHYGYLDSDTDTDNRLYSDIKGWKWTLAYEFFRGLMYKSHGGYTYPAAYGAISNGLYLFETAKDCLNFFTKTYDSILGKEYGFVHYLGATGSAQYVDDDWGTFVAWILTTPKNERDSDLKTYDRLKQKYDIVIPFYRENYNIDLEALSVKIQSLTID